MTLLDAKPQATSIREPFVNEPVLELRRSGIRGQLTSLGVGRIADDDRCTAESDELYSYRRDGTTGRFAGLIWLAP